ncbi:hypothetical protein [Mycobacterium numidiamassiliense]|nr:hypothetical protein [Mycobacterium numidiamassiliense]
MDEDLVAVERHIEECGARLSTPDRRWILAALAPTALGWPSTDTG